MFQVKFQLICKNLYPLTTKTENIIFNKENPTFVAAESPDFIGNDSSVAKNKHDDVITTDIDISIPVSDGNEDNKDDSEKEVDVWEVHVSGK